MNIGLYFGSFNPIHVGHLIIANHIVEYTDLDEIWFVVSPQNPLKKKATLLDNHHRLELVNRAIENYPKFKASDVEFKLPRPSYTVDTLVVLNEKYPNHKFNLIMGEDNLKSLTKWKNYEVLLEDYHIYVYPRISEATQVSSEIMDSVTKVNAPIIEISSTYIRKGIKSEKDIRPLVPYKVWEYIDLMNFYKK